MSVDSKDWGNPQVATGSWTSTACCATLQTETLGYQPSFVLVISDSGTDSLTMWIKHAGESNENVLIATDGTLTSPADAGGITLTSTGFTFAVAAQVASGTNQWIAFR